MTSTGYLNANEALQELGLYNPANNTMPNQRYLKYLCVRGLLVPYKVSGRKISYKKSDCEKLFKKSVSEGICLTTKPVKP